MTNEISGDEILSDAQLDQVADGNIGDRAIVALWIINCYGTNGTHGKIIDTSTGEPNSIVANFCDKAGIDYQQNTKGFDQFKINGQWRDALWIAQNKQETFDFFDKQLGLK